MWVKQKKKGSVDPRVSEATNSSKACGPRTLPAPTEAEEALNLMEAESTNKSPMGLEAESEEKMTMSPRGGPPLWDHYWHQRRQKKY